MTNKENGLPTTEPLWEVPIHWKWCSILDVGNIITGNTPSTKVEANYGTDIPFVKPPELMDRSIRSASSGLSEKGMKTARILPAGSVLVSCIGGLGKTGITKVPVAFNQQINAIIFNKNILPEYGFYYTQTLKPWLYGVSSATTLPIVNKGKFQRAPFPLAPLNEQKRIVAEIEKQFSRLDEAVANLKRVKANLKRYKAAVLKAAVEGKLTEEWRKQHPYVEPASKLLERILTERRKKWEQAELAKMTDKGKMPKNNKWKKKYKEPDNPELVKLPSIPDTWTWVTLPQLGELNRGKSKYRPRNATFLYGGPYPFIQTGDIRHAEGIVTKYNKTYSEHGLKQSRLWPVRTLCITIAANIADTAILGFEGCFPDSVVGFIPESEHTIVQFIEYFLRTAKKNLERFAPATAQKNINLAILKKVAVPLPPKKEQYAIVQEIESRFSVAKAIEDTVNTNLKRAERLRQSILKQAFSGQLVPSNPTDEPASVFLDRIRKTSSDRTTKKKTSRAGGKAIKKERIPQ